MAIAFVQSKSAQGSASPPSLTLTSTATSGNLLVVAVSSSLTGTHTVSGFTALTSASAGSGAAQRSLRLFYKVSVGTESVITSSAQSNWDMFAAEYSGIYSVTQLDVENCAVNAAGTTQVTPSVTPTSAVERLIVSVTMHRDNLTPSNIQIGGTTSGVNSRETQSNSNNDSTNFADKIIASTSGSYSGSSDWSTSKVGAGGIAIFQGVPAATEGSNQLMMMGVGT